MNMLKTAKAPDAKTGSAGERFTLPAMPGAALPTGAARMALGILGQRIANDVYRPGEVMPTEVELAESLGMSRATIRDAVKVLSGKGLVRTARRYGTRVRPVAEWNLFDADLVSWHEPGHPRLMKMFTETTEMRIIIEPAAAAMAAERATPEQLETILDAARDLSQDGDLEALFAADCRFHATILEATGNQMMSQLRPLILSMLRISYEYGVVQRGQAVAIGRQRHVEVAQAIVARDSEGARQAMAEMLEQNQRVAHEVAAG